MSTNRKYYNKIGKNSKFLGQHFLINKNKLQKIIESLELKPEETIVEIGSGHGELTRLLAKNLQIIAIEKDEYLARNLQKKFVRDEKIKIIQGDALKIIPGLKIKNYKLVGNIPYYITGYLLRTLGELENKPSLIVLTVQKEVAGRICSQPPKMNLLAASIQFWAEPEIIDYISKKDFHPIPKVDSAIIKLKTITLSRRSPKKCYEEDYYKLIKILFKQPRKTILNNLKNLKNKKDITKILKALKINPNDRPQNLTIEQIKKMTSQSSLSCLKPESPRGKRHKGKRRRRQGQKNLKPKPAAVIDTRKTSKPRASTYISRAAADQ